MTVQYSSREFNQQTARARRAALQEPVFITDRGEPKHVLLSIEEYRRLSATRLSLADLLTNADVADIDLELPPRVIEPFVYPFADDSD
ncbi:type II toxin-antitoxin system Phd/YefM family antitoxin [Sphingomonas sp.]|uniref:type II toxin-antitoxin system Phd/YefM family antitoxin n=1 Tax=Sphingomonas sp. TaxID=28214 RepID=UPI003CC5DDE4